MGKPFKKELLSIKDTIIWGENQDISILNDFFELDNFLPLLSIGSGGSFSACHYSTLLYESEYTLSKALTPLDFFYSKNIINHAKVLFISASGKNTDIQFAFKKSQDFGSKKIANLSMKAQNPLGRMSKVIGNPFSANYDLPTGKDGFLATNSLIAFFTLLYRSFCKDRLNIVDHLSCFNIDEYINDYSFFADQMQSRSNFTVLYGGWGLPVAYDVESKFTEAALGAVQLTDYRNFGHGRHHWFDKQKDTSSIIAIVSPNEKKIAEKTLSLIPYEIPRLIINTDINSPLASIDLLIKSFYLVSLIGDVRDIDPGKPGVPDFGSKLYNLKYSSFYKEKKGNIDRKTIAILRKSHVLTLNELTEKEQKRWSEAYSVFVQKINSAEYTSLVLDYDGTLSPIDSRYETKLTPIVKSFFHELLKNNIKIGIVTGRGKSIKKLLRDSISKEFWSSMYIGYYNGADVGTLDDNSIPDSVSEVNESLKLIKDSLIQEYFIDSNRFEVDLRPVQLTIKTKTILEYKHLKDICHQIILIKGLSNVIILESSHSMDIIVRPKVSKLNIISSLFSDDKVLCIGDKGCVPGNDFELLSTPYSLSVDEVSYHPKSCWNLVPEGIKNYDALFFYFDRFIVNDGFFKILL